jgi:dipeptidyl aminopeptidase/acylaminoacyl peptidase
LNSKSLLSTVLLLILGASSPAFADASAAGRLLTAEDIDRVQSLSDPQVSPDGQWVAYVVAANDRDADEARSAIWMVSWDGSQRLALTGAADGTSKPRWSPDGRNLAFLATPAGSDKSQIMLLDRRGGEPRPLTSVSGDISGYSWSPDGKRLAIVMEQGDQPSTRTMSTTTQAAQTPQGETAAEKSDAGAQSGKSDSDKAPKPMVIEAIHFKDDEDGYLSTGHGRHLFVIDIASKRLDAITTDPQFNEDLPVWSPDGGRIAFIRTHEKGPDQDGREDIDIVDARAGAEVKTLVRPFAPNGQALAWSPDGTLVSYLQGLEAKFNAYMQDRLVVVPVAGGAPRPLTDKLDRAVMSYAFTGNSAITIAVEDDGTQYPARVDVVSGTITREGVAGPFVVSAISSAGGHTALLESTDGTFDEVYALESAGLRKLTSHNDAFLAELKLGAVEDVRFKSKDGTDVHGLVVKPPSFVPGRRYPTVLWIHGGPNGQDEHSLVLDGYQFEPQLLAAKGYVVLCVNYRGGSGRGLAYAKAIFADWGHKEVEDLLAGVDYLVAQGIADAQRLGVGGWSYGGILTDYTIATDRRFKVAVSGAGSADQISMYGSDEYILQYNAELGPPWRDTALWLKVSYPFFHADRIHTPTLFLGGEKDFNVPVNGGEQMYEALRTLGVPAQLVVYPGQHHVFTRPSFVRDLAVRVPAWYDRYLEPAR